jgi:hypothetical protein
MDSSTLTAPVDSLTVKENRVAAPSEVALETLFTCEEWIRQASNPVDS